MKRFFALLLALTMLLMLPACGTDTNIRGEQKDNSTEAPDEKKADFSMGKVSGLTYENEFIGIGCKLDSAWTFRTDEEIREMNNLAGELAGEEYQAAIKNATLVYDMNAVHINGMDNIIINLEKVNPLQLAAADLEDVFEQQLPLLKSSFENMGYTNMTFKIDEVTIDGKTFVALFTSGSIGDYQMYQASIAIKCNSYLASIAITTFSEEMMNTLLESFYLV